MGDPRYWRLRMCVGSRDCAAVWCVGSEWTKGAPSMKHINRSDDLWKNVDVEELQDREEYSVLCCWQVCCIWANCCWKA